MLPAFKSDGQQLSFSPSFSDTPLATDLSLIGKSNNRIYALSSPFTGEPRLLLFDTSMLLQNKLSSGLLKGAVPIYSGNRSNGIRLITESAYDNIDVYQELLADDSGLVQVNNLISLPANRRENWAFVSSPSGTCHLLYNITEPANDSISIRCIVLDSNREIRKMQTLAVPFSAEFDRLNSLYLDDHGNTWILVYDQPLNYKLGCTLRAWCLKPDKEEPLYRELYVKEKKPSDFLLQFDEARNSNGFYSLYVDFYSSDIKGILSFSLNNELKESSPLVAFEFDKETKKDMQRLTGGITRDDLLNYLRLLHVTNRDNTGPRISATLDYSAYKLGVDTSRGIAGRSPYLTEQNPLRTAYQRDMLTRQLSGTERRRGRSRFRDGTTFTPSPIPLSEAMRLRPDLFFLQDNNIPQGTMPVSTRTSRIYNKHLFFSFDSLLQVKGYQWYKKEFFPDRELNRFAFFEDGDELISFRYDHNKKDKLALIVTIINTRNGDQKEISAEMPHDTRLQLSVPVIRTGPRSYVFIYHNSMENKKGLAKLSW